MISNKDYFFTLLLDLGAEERLASQYVEAIDSQDLWSEFPEDLDVVRDFKRFVQIMNTTQNRKGSSFPSFSV